MPTEEDKQSLIDCLHLIESQLRHIVFDLKGLFWPEFTESFPGPWKEVAHRFALAKKQIETDDINWEYVEGVGLTGPTLAWKRDLMAKAAKRGFIGRFLKFANSFLGSLAKGLPVVEFIKEYKEMVEGCIAVIPVFAW
jgi:hypothetical protein